LRIKGAGIAKIQMKLTKEQIILLADRFYPDNRVQLSWDFKNHTLHPDVTQAGDLLARFIACELSEVYDSRPDQPHPLLIAVHYLERAGSEIDKVTTSLLTVYLDMMVFDYLTWLGKRRRPANQVSLEAFLMLVQHDGAHEWQPQIWERLCRYVGVPGSTPEISDEEQFKKVLTTLEPIFKLAPLK
jgi:hypothetical protein